MQFPKQPDRYELRTGDPDSPHIPEMPLCTGTELSEVIADNINLCFVE
jgi:hypothetical protein